MPMYVFACGVCDHTEEHYIPVRDSVLTVACEVCGKPSNRDVTKEHRLHRPANGYPYITTHFNGQPVEVRSGLHEAELCKKFNVRKRDDAAFLEDYSDVRFDWKTKKTVYRERTGVGMPNCWI